MLVLAHLHRSVLTQQVHSLGHLAFKWRSSFAKALAKLSPNFREKSPNSFYKMIHIYIINIKYKYLQCNFAQKITFAISEKNFLAETVNCIPKGLRKGNPFHGPFAQTLMYRSRTFCSSLNTKVMTALGMCKVCTEAVLFVAFWTRRFSRLWACVQ